MAADFITDSNMVAFFGAINPEFVTADIPAFVRTGAYQEINLRTDLEPNLVANATIYLDGRGDKMIFCPTLPIVRLDAISVINRDTDETALIVDQTDRDRQVWYDPNTGAIELIQPISGIEYYPDNDDHEVGVFPKGVCNIKITGRFGTTDANNILTLLQLYLMLRHMSHLNPDTYGAGDIVSEHIGKYSYTLAGNSSGGDKKRMSLDELINYLFSLVDEPFHYDSV